MGRGLSCAATVTLVREAEVEGGQWPAEVVNRGKVFNGGEVVNNTVNGGGVSNKTPDLSMSVVSNTDMHCSDGSQIPRERELLVQLNDVLCMMTW